jgi:hypothetical protein
LEIGTTVAADVAISARYEEWLRVSHLAMEPQLASAEHPFIFDNQELRVRLPGLPPDPPGEDATAAIYSRRAASGEPVSIGIYAIRVVISGLKFSLPAAAASYPGTNTSLYTGEQIRELNLRSDDLWRLCRRAIDYWLRVVRHRTAFALVDLDRYFGDDATWKGGQLVNCESGHRFYVPHVQRTIVAPAMHRLTMQEWTDIGSDLQKGASPPIWHEYLMSARQRIEVGDLKAAVIDLATCSELAMRKYVDTALPTGTPPGVREIVARHNMSRMFSDWENLGLPPMPSVPDFKTLKELSETRNRVAHRGQDPRATDEFCKKASSAVMELIAAFNQHRADWDQNP